MEKKSLLSWVLEFAGRKKSYFLGSVILAMLGVAASFIVKGTDIEPSEKRISSVCSPALIKDR